MFSFTPILKLIGMETNPKYTFKYGGDLEYIDINVLIYSQLQFLELIKEVQANIAPELKLQTKVKYLPKGSWQYEFMFGVFPGIFTTVSLTKIKSIISTTTEIIKLKKELKGRKIAAIEDKGNSVSITVTGNNNTVLVVPKDAFRLAETNKKIDDAVNKMISVVSMDKEITSIEMLDEQKNVLMEVKDNEFEDTKKPNPLLEKPDTQQEIKTNANLAMAYVKDGKWDFIYDGNKIPVHINDNDFNDKISKGQEGFFSGDKLIVDLIINKTYDKQYDVYVNSSYIVEKVHDHTQRTAPKQGKMEL